MSKDSLNRAKGEGEMPANTLTKEVVDELYARNIIVSDPNDDGQPRGPPPQHSAPPMDNRGPPPPGWNNQGPPPPSYPAYPPHGVPPPRVPPQSGNSHAGMKRSRDNWGDNAPYPKRY